MHKVHIRYDKYPSFLLYVRKHLIGWHFHHNQAMMFHLNDIRIVKIIIPDKDAALLIKLMFG